MDRKNYVEYLIERNKLIYIDTSTLMNIEQLRLFIGRVESTFLMNNRRIIVPNVVYAELTKHATSDNRNKQTKAMEALDLIEQFNELFDIEKDFCLEKDFADPELLARITLYKSDSSQLLITNDNALSLDAFRLNEQKSTQGFKVMVCRINGSGYLNECGCVKEYREFVKSNELETKSEIKKEIIEKVHYVYKEKTEQKVWYKGWKGNTVIGIGLFAGGIAIDKYVFPALKRVIKVA